MSLSYKAKQKMLRMETQAKFPYLIEITRTAQDGTTEVFRYANCDEDLTFEGNLYKAGFFKVEPPEQKQSGFSDSSLILSAIDKENDWIGKIRSTSKRAKARFVATIQHWENQETIIEPMEDSTFILTVVNWDDTTIQWTMKYDELMDIQVPCDECNSQIIPALG